MTPRFKIKLNFFLRELFNSYTEQCLCIFGQARIKMYGKDIHVQNTFYQPSSISQKISFKYLTQLCKMITINNRLASRKNPNFVLDSLANTGTSSRLGPLNSGVTPSQIKVNFSRMVTPAIDGHIMAQYLKLMASDYNFNQICSKMSQKVAFPDLSNSSNTSPILEKSKSRSPVLELAQSGKINYKTEVQLQGMIIKLHGRIPREPVRPRKTIQSKMLGSQYRHAGVVSGERIFIAQNGHVKTTKSFLNSLRNSQVTVGQATGINPELGTFSIWVKSII